jgi:hypothetical protein
VTGSNKRGFVVLITLAQLALVGWLDYLSSYEVSLAIFYYVPIAYAAWNLGAAWSFAFSALAAITLTWMELAAGRHYSSVWFLAERQLMRLLVFSFVAYSFNFFRRAIEREREKVRQLEGMLTVCSCCRKTRDEDGNWISLDVFLQEKSGVRADLKVCPTCAREVYAKDGLKDKPTTAASKPTI